MLFFTLSKRFASIPGHGASTLSLPGFDAEPRSFAVEAQGTDADAHKRDAGVFGQRMSGWNGFCSGRAAFRPLIARGTGFSGLKAALQDGGLRAKSAPHPAFGRLLPAMRGEGQQRMAETKRQVPQDESSDYRKRKQQVSGKESNVCRGTKAATTGRGHAANATRDAFSPPAGRRCPQGG